MLQFAQVDYSFRITASEHETLTDIGFTLMPGLRTVCMGANGSGKTTLARLAASLYRPTRGQVLIDGLDTADAHNRIAVRRLVGLVASDADSQIICTTVQDEVAFGPENLGLDPEVIAERVKQSLAAVGLGDKTERDPNTLSGGQKQLLVLAAVLAMQPRYLVLDEPTAMLDHEARREFMAIIEELRQGGHGILHITHDLTALQAADQVLVLQQGRLVFTGSAEDLLARPEQMVEWKISLPGDVGRLESGGQAARQPARASQQPMPNRRRLVMDDVRFTYLLPDGQTVDVLKGLALTVEAGSYTLVSGPSGAGKSTLLKLAAGLLQPDSGSIYIKSAADPAAVQSGARQNAPNTWRAAPGLVGLTFQFPEDQLFAITVAEDILFGPRNLKLLGSNQKNPTDSGGAGVVAAAGVSPHFTNEDDLVAWALREVGLDAEQYAQRSPFELSGGEMRRVAIAGVLSMQPTFLLFDEPTAGLDAQGRLFFHQLVDEQLQQGRAVLVVSHDIDEFAGRVDRHLVLADGVLWPM